MNCKSRAALSICLAGTLLQTAAGQNTRVIPAANATVEGTGSSMHPFGTLAGRTQQVWTGASVTSAAAFIDGFSYRCNSPIRNAHQGRAYSNLSLEFGATSVTPSTMSTTFATNITSALTTVFSGAYNLPPQARSQTSPAPFSITFSWSQPFVFSPTSGNLLADIKIPGTSGRDSYSVDAYVAGGGSGQSVKPFGAAGKFSSPETARLIASNQAIIPGGSLDIMCRPFTKSYTGNLMFSMSNTTWGSIALPLDLALIGAPGNNLYIGMDLVVPFNASGGGGRNAGSRFQAAIPAQTPVGLTFYAQAYYVDAAANAAGLVTTRGLGIMIGSGSGGSSVTNQLGSMDSASATGRFPFGVTLGGPVVQFSGVLP